MRMKKIYIQPALEIYEILPAGHVLTKGSDYVESFKKGNDINVGDTDDANVMSKSLWDEGE